MAGSRSVRKLLAQAEGMPFGFAKTAVTEEAVRAADALNDLDAAFDARVALSSAAVHGGEPQKALVAITWCLGQLDAHPDRFDRYATYWGLKWLPTTLVDVPGVPWTEIEDIVGEIERRYTAAGEGADAVAKLRWILPLIRGQVAEAAAAHRAWRLLPRSEFSDCRACDVSAEVRLALALDEPERALSIARPLLAGRLTCGEEPAWVLGRLLSPLHELSRYDEAERLHTWGLRLARGNPSLVSAQAQHVVHLVRTGRLPEAFELAAELVDVCDRGLFNAYSRMEALAAAGCATAAWSEAGLPHLPRRLGERPAEAAALAATLASEARALAASFDGRNTTDDAGSGIEWMLAIRPTTTHQPPVQPPATPATPSAVPAGAGGVPPAPSEDGPQDLLDRARKRRGSAEERHDAARRALAGFRSAGDDAGAARALRTVGEALFRLERLEEAGAALDEAVAALADQPHELMLAALSRARVSATVSERTDDPDARRFLAAARAAAERDPAGAQALGRVRLLEAEWAVLGQAPAEVIPGFAAEDFADARRLLEGDPELLLDAWAAESWSRGVVGDIAGAEQAAETAWELATRSGDDDAVGIAAEVLIPCLLHEGHDERAIDVLALAQRAAERVGELVEAAKAAVTRADLLADADRMEEGLAAAFAGSDLCLAAGDGTAAAWARVTAARCFRALDRDQNAADLLAELMEQAAEDGDKHLEGAVALEFAQLNADFGLLDDALELGRRAASCFGPEDGHSLCRVYRTIAQLHEAAGAMGPALAAGESCVAALTDEEVPAFAAGVRQETADRLVRGGQAYRALELYDAARAGFADAAVDVAVASVDLGRAEALQALGRGPEAVALAQDVLRIAEREDVPGLRADALWAIASFQSPEAERYEIALAAYEQAGAPPELLADLVSQRDKALGRTKSRWRR